MPTAHALALFAELCSAVGALHAQALVHRDLKPENVFTVDGAHAVLLDFGIAKELDAPASTTTMDGGVRGTPAYMAPERFFGQPAGVTTGLYELAVVLYAMLAGRLPWDDLADPEARLSPRPLVELADVPAALDIEIRRALSTRAPNRPPSAEALLAGVLAAAGASGDVGVAAGDPARMGRARDVAPPAPRPWFAERAVPSPRTTDPALAWSRDLLPAGTSAALWARPTDGGLTFEVGLDLPREADAVALAATLDAELRTVVAQAAPAVGAVRVERARARVTIRGDLSTLMIGIVSGALGKSE